MEFLSTYEQQLRYFSRRNPRYLGIRKALRRRALTRASKVAVAVSKRIGAISDALLVGLIVEVIKAALGL